MKNRKELGLSSKTYDSLGHVNLSDKLQKLGSFTLKNAVCSVTIGACRREKMGSGFSSWARMSLGKTKMERGTLTTPNEFIYRSRSSNIDSLLGDDGQGRQNMKPSPPKPVALATRHCFLAYKTYSAFHQSQAHQRDKHDFPPRHPLSGPTPQKMSQRMANHTSTLRPEATGARAASSAATVSNNRVNSSARNEWVPNAYSSSPKASK